MSEEITLTLDNYDLCERADKSGGRSYVIGRLRAHFGKATEHESGAENRSNKPWYYLLRNESAHKNTTLIIPVTHDPAFL